MIEFTLTSQIGESIRQLLKYQLELAEDAFKRDAIQLTGGIPVYEDLGGMYLMTPQGDIFSVYADDGRMAIVGDERLRAIAIINATKRYPILKDILPSQSSTSVVCRICGGKGLIDQRFICGNCLGLGWSETK